MRPFAKCIRQGIVRIAGDEDKRELALGDDFNDGIDTLAGEGDIEHGDVIIRRPCQTCRLFEVEASATT